MRTQANLSATTLRLRSVGLLGVLPVMVLLSESANAQYVQIAASHDHALALRTDGTIGAWGSYPTPWTINNDMSHLDVPALPQGLSYVEVAAGGTGETGWWDTPLDFSMARRSDGAVLAWGNNWYGQTDVPALPQGVTYTQIDAGNLHAAALRSDGSVAAWGNNDSGQCNVPTLPLGLTYVEVSAGGWVHEREWCGGIWPPPPELYLHGTTAARRNDGSVVVWGDNSFGQANVPQLAQGLSFVEISVGSTHVAGRLSDGSVIAWGDNQFGQCDVPLPPVGLVYDQVAAAGGCTVTRLSDGTVSTWGPSSLPALPNGSTYTDVTVGGAYWLYEYWDAGNCSLGSTTGSWNGAYAHFIALRSDGSLVAWGGNLSVEANATSYCASSVNSTGCAATLQATGSARLSFNELTLSADCVPNGAAMFFHGPARQQVPFGDGTLCATGGLVRLMPASLASGGQAQAVVDLPSAGIQTPGVRNFQCYFRDPAAGGAGFNSSDALEITFVP